MKSIPAQCAAAIKAELKSVFPGIKFSVVSGSPDTGTFVRISYLDGPTINSLIAVVDKYCQGHFNKPFSVYEYDNEREDIPQVKFVTADRDHSDKIEEAIKKELKSSGGIFGLIEVWNVFKMRDYDAKGNYEIAVDSEEKPLKWFIVSLNRVGENYIGTCCGTDKNDAAKNLRQSLMKKGYKVYSPRIDKPEFIEFEGYSFPDWKSTDVPAPNMYAGMNKRLNEINLSPVEDIQI